MSNSHFLEFLELVKPSVKFDKFNSPEKPNYEKMNSWAAHPDRAVSYTHLTLPTILLV